MDDQRRRHQRGDPVLVEYYLEQTPALASDPETLLDLIYHEVVLREQRGEQPTLLEYQHRFPAHAQALADLFEVHGALGAEPPTLQTTTATHASTTLPPPPSSPEDPSWPLLSDYEILDVLGQGGMGVVYRARDRKRRSTLALKTMHHVDPSALYRFKQEFRALRDVVHPNLVTLYELVSDARTWFITMELIDGVDFLTYVRQGFAPAEYRDWKTEPEEDLEPTSTQAAPADPPPTQPLTAREPFEVPTVGESTGEGEELGAVEASRSASPRSFAKPGQGLAPEARNRLRSALRQLADGINALHRADKFHRDIKPSNVLVARDGRVVLMDFGLATERRREPLDLSGAGQVVGTVAYMAPEQAAGSPIGPASDWYSVGVMLFEALTGRLPFLGRALDVLMDKQRFEPPAPRELVPDVPEDLNALCVDLLRRDPRARPSGLEVARRLGSMADNQHTPALSTTSQSLDVPLVGRERHLDALNEAFEAVRRGRTVVQAVHGRSGVGKSALVRAFLNGLADQGEIVVLEGRCHEGESVPYKALDSLIDGLCRYLRRLPESEADALMPRDIGALARVFPVLRRVEAVTRAPRRPSEAPDPQELRRRAFSALRELLVRLGDRRPLVLVIDDLQWGDTDSLALLSEVLRPPDPPVLLLLGCYRGEDGIANPFTSQLGLDRLPTGSTLDCRELAVEVLPPSDSQALALSLLGRADPIRKAHAERIARESGGNPFFIAELARSIPVDEPGSDHQKAEPIVSLDEMLWSRILRLPVEARQLLELVAVSGRPLRRIDAVRSLDLNADERGALALLKSGRLIRSAGTAEDEGIETYHDRVRETVVARLDRSTRREHHRRLARTLEESGRADPEVLGVHFQGAGDLEAAGRYFAQAAAQAAETLAFDRAAALYDRALDLQPANGPEVRRLRQSLADALANAGRGAEAARQYLVVASGATVAEAFELRRRAAMQFLMSGHVDQGLSALRAVLEAVGMRLPRTPRQALWSLLTRRAWLRCRGLRFSERDPSQVAASELSRIDVCWSASAGLSMIDPIRGADFQTRGLLLALRAGEPARIARSLAMEAAHIATVGVSARPRTERLLERAERLARKLGQPYTNGMTMLTRGVAAYLEGRWRAALDACDQAETIFRDNCTGVAWELDTAHSFALWSLAHLGEVAEVDRRRTSLIQEARERGDLYAVMNLSTLSMTLVRLAADAPEEALDELRAIVQRWSRQGYHIQHNDQLWTEAQIELYRGRNAEAWNLIARHWPTLSASMLLRVQFVRVTMRHLRARCALAAARTAERPRPLLRVADQEARRLDREGVPWAIPYARSIQASLAVTRGDHSQALALLKAAASGFDAAEMRLYAAAARRQWGVLDDGPEGRAQIDQADAWMNHQGIQVPERMAAMLVPVGV